MNKEEALDLVKEQINLIVTETNRLAKAEAGWRALHSFIYTSTQPPAPSPVEYVWFLPSRTGGNGHYVSADYADNRLLDWTCTCPAGEKGRTCWAVRGLQNTAVYTLVNDQQRSFTIWVDGSYHVATRMDE